MLNAVKKRLPKLCCFLNTRNIALCFFNFYIVENSYYLKIRGVKKLI